MKHETMEATLIDIVESSPKLMMSLQAVQLMDLESWCIGAGAIRSLVWDRLHEYSVPSTVPDIDVAYFDSNEISTSELMIQHRLTEEYPEVPWEVTNQATVHHWYEREFGQPVEPVASLFEGIATWPEFATCVGVALNAKSQVIVFAPFGLDDLFSMIVRRNPARVSEVDFSHRIHQKSYDLRWPKVKIL